MESNVRFKNEGRFYTANSKTTETRTFKDNGRLTANSATT